MKREKRRNERIFQSSHLTVHKHIYQSKCQEYYGLIQQTKVDYYKQKIERSDTKQLFKLVNDLSNVKTAPILPEHDCIETLANTFNDHFISKVENLREQFLHPKRCNMETPLYLDTPKSTLREFTVMTSDDIQRTIMSSPSKSCQLDPLPTGILKQCLKTLLPAIVKIVNASLKNGSVPSAFKTPMSDRF